VLRRKKKKGVEKERECEEVRVVKAEETNKTQEQSAIGDWRGSRDLGRPCFHPTKRRGSVSFNGPISSAWTGEYGQCFEPERKGVPQRDNGKSRSVEIGLSPTTTSDEAEDNPS